MNKIILSLFLLSSFCCAMDNGAITLHKHVPSLKFFAANNLPSTHNEVYSKIKLHFDETPSISLYLNTVVKQGIELKYKDDRLSSNVFWLKIQKCKHLNRTSLRHWFSSYMNNEAKRSFLHHLDIKEHGDWLDEVVLHCSVNHVKEILQTVPVTPEKKQQALFEALLNNKIDSINLLINHGAIFNLDKKSFDRVVWSNHVGMVELVLSHQEIPKDWLSGVFFSIYNSMACYDDDLSPMVQLLIKHGATMEQRTAIQHQNELIATGYYTMAFAFEKFIHPA